MKPSFVLLSLCLSLLDITNSAPLPVDRDLRIAPLNDRTYDVVNALVIDPLHLAPAEAHGTLVRRVGFRGRKSKKSDAEKQEDANRVLKNNNGESSKAAQEKRVEDKEAENDTKRATVDTRGQEKKEVDAQLTPKQKADRDASMAEERRKEEEFEKDEKDPNVVAIAFRSRISERVLEEFWKDFQAPRRGADKKGLIHKDDIARAFRACVPRDSFMFWSANKDKSFERGAVTVYEKSVKKKIIANALKLSACKTQDLVSMQRPSMFTHFDQWIEKKEKDEHLRRSPKDRSKIFKYHWMSNFQNKAHSTLNYDFYWAVMSTGYAAGAHGEVHYFRPDRKAGETTDYKGTHWVNYELPELVKNDQVTVVKEFTMRKTRGGSKGYKDEPVNPNSGIIRVQNGKQLPITVTL